MKVLVCGDRNWTDERAIHDVLRDVLHPHDVVIHGDCRGADKIAAHHASLLGNKTKAYPANWDEYGKAAGPIRNQQMIDEEHPDLVIAFHDDLEKSKGTRHMLTCAKAAGIPRRWFKHSETRQL